MLDRTPTDHAVKTSAAKPLLGFSQSKAFPALYFL